MIERFIKWGDETFGEFLFGVIFVTSPIWLTLACCGLTSMLYQFGVR